MYVVYHFIMGKENVPILLFCCFERLLSIYFCVHCHYSFQLDINLVPKGIALRTTSSSQRPLQATDIKQQRHDIHYGGLKMLLALDLSDC